MLCLRLSKRVILLSIPILALADCPILKAQVPLLSSSPGQAVRMFPTDWAVLETQEPRTDLPCLVNPVKPVVGFDMRFHAGYEIRVPLRELAGASNSLTIIFRVTPEAGGERPHYFVQRIPVPEIEPNTGGEASLQGVFDLGEGRYHVDWLMRDRADRLCSFYWEAEALLAAKDRQLGMTIPPETVEAADAEPFREEPPVERAQGEPPLNVKILLNFAPPDASSPVLQPPDTLALVSILRSIAREPRVGKFSLVAFNLQEQRVFYRQENADRIDFPALGQALGSLRLGTVDLRRLSHKNGETDFLANLIQQELGGRDHPDALVFAGPKAMLEEEVPRGSLKEVGDVEYPVFYMNYNLAPQLSPWRDAIGRTVRFFRGSEFTISRPRDLWAATSDMIARIVKFRTSRRAASTAAQ